MTSIESRRDAHTPPRTPSQASSRSPRSCSPPSLSVQGSSSRSRPGRCGTSIVAVILALVSARLSARYQSLALVALLFAMVAWVVGMTLAVLTENPLF